MTTHGPNDPQQTLTAALTLIRQFVPSAIAGHLEMPDYALTGSSSAKLTADRDNDHLRYDGAHYPN